MSKVLSKDAKKVVYTTVRTLEGITCDACGKVIPASSEYTQRKNTKYFNVITGHHDWGNDSYESRKRRDICPECINRFVAEYLDSATGSEYIEIETEYAYPTDVHEDEDE